MPTRREFIERSTRAMAACAVAGLAPSALLASPSGDSKKTVPRPALTGTAGTQSLRAHAEARGLLVGCAAVPERLVDEPDYASIVAAQADILVAENAMKWAALRPAPDRFDFSGADELLRFAAGHGQKLRGHNLCWHEALPGWFAGTATRQNARQLLTQHIETVAGRYAGQVHSWDVVNEAIDARGDRPDGLRKSPWLDLIGSDYIELAFHTAKKADPTALLTYNDYGIELDTPDNSAKRALVMLLVRRLKARGVPIDAVGVQSHLEAGGPVPGAGLTKFVRDLGDLGLQVFITELDVSDQKLSGPVAERDQAVAAVYTQYLQLMLAEPNVRAVLTWGITDRYTWIGHEKPRTDGQSPRPLPFDSDYQPAPAFYAMRAALDGRNQSLPAATGAAAANPYAPFTPKQ